MTAHPTQHLSDFTAIPAASESRSAVDFDGLEVPTIIRSQESLLCSRTAPETNPRGDGERKANPDDASDPFQMLDTEADQTHETDVAYLTDLEEKTREDFDHTCGDLPSSQLPSSSPPQLFSSSPCASSQSSVGDIEPSKMVRVIYPPFHCADLRADHTGRCQRNF